MSLLRLLATVLVALWLLGVCLSTLRYVASGASFGGAMATEQAQLGERAAACGEAIGSFHNTMWQLAPKSREWTADRMGAQCLRLLVPL